MFKIEYWSEYRKRWVEYTPIAINARPLQFGERSLAEHAMKRMERDHPRDKFRITGSETK